MINWLVHDIIIIHLSLIDHIIKFYHFMDGSNHKSTASNYFYLSKLENTFDYLCWVASTLLFKYYLQKTIENQS